MLLLASRVVAAMVRNVKIFQVAFLFAFLWKTHGAVEAPRCPPENIKGETTIYRELKLTWEPPKTENSWNPIKGYNLIGCFNPDNCHFHENTKSTNITTDVKTTLRSSTNYTFFISAYTEDENEARFVGPPGMVSVITSDITPTTKPLNITVVEWKENYIKLAWEAAYDDQLNSTYDGYIVMGCIGNDCNFVANTSKTEFETTIKHNLRPNTEYNFFVAAYNEGYDQEAVVGESSQISVTTPNGAFKAVVSSLPLILIACVITEFRTKYC